MDLVTGGAGFLGAHLVERLARDGPVRVLDAMIDQPADPADRLRAAVARWERHPRIRFVHGDVRDPRAVREALDGVGRVFHLAAATGARRSVFAPDRVVDNNTRGTAVLLQAMEELAVPQLVLASSAAVYGEVVGRATEHDPPLPVSPYGASKLGAEGLVSAWSAQGGRAAVLRLATVYGPGQRPDMAVGRFVEAALRDREALVFGSGEMVRDHLYVDDAVDALARAASHDGRWLLANVGSGVGVRTLELVDRVRAATGRRVRVQIAPDTAGEPARTVLDPDLAARRLGWTPRVPLEEGLRRVVTPLRSGSGRTA